MNPRFEVKIPIPLNRLQQIENWLTLHPSLFRRHYETRYINSLYLDNPFLDRYQENLSGISARKKTRLRWYHQLASPAHATLEHKYRRGGKGWKIQHPVSLNWQPDNPCWSRVLQQYFVTLPANIQATIGNEQSPIVIIRYLRDYYISADGKLRLTFDRNMECYDQRYFNVANFSHVTSLGEYVLLEIKTDADNEQALSRLVGSCPLRPSRHSKYVNGIRQLIWL
ncbi:polyphosphate polymerase domain-containing protein [Photobacterium phosphoreum]|uniref:polyphosphate polymerase domain-containing protein n=1 Tax=Photobacterium phosphoreum TaxID=659 RepID=UPI0007F8B3CA|nr:polyphosphate polymerase domain-containing protein [Photobacterium phosphoreum]OBU36991.1 VTC domain-containing protein [Photobacterium phosphoreum]PSW36288.1 VTC domain-containing protein [Photobacterium phosphoreum]